METDKKAVVLVTGSTGGIGANIAIDLSAKGHRIIVTGRDQVKINNVVARCNSQAQGESPACGFMADLMHMNQIDKLLNFVKETFGYLDILINNTCFRGQPRDILDTSYEEYSQIYHMNVTVPIYLIHKATNLLKNSTDHTQVVVNISSTASQVVVPLHGYSVSKNCLSEMTRQLNRHNGLLCVTISPGPVLTDERPAHAKMKSLTLIDRVGTTQEISNAVLHCLENIDMFNGQEIFVDGGYLAREHVGCCIEK